MLRQAANLARIDLDRLPQAKTAPEKSLLAAAMKQCTSAPNGWIAVKLPIGKAATASQCARRWLRQTDQKETVGRLIEPLRSREIWSRVET